MLSPLIPSSSMHTTRSRNSSLLRPAAGAAAALMLLASGCATSADPKPTTPQQRADSTPSQAEQWSKLGYRLDWRGFPTMLPGETVRFLDILGDVVAVQESAGVVSVLEARSGITRWSDQVAGRLTKFVGNIREGDRLLVSSESEVYFYDIATGNLKNKQRLAQVVNTKPVKVNDILVYGCANGQLLGHYTINGFRAWGSGLTGSIETDPLLLGTSGRIAISSTTGDLIIIDGQTGLSQGRGKMFAGPGAPFAASDVALYIASSDQSLYAFNADTGAQIWRKRTEAPLVRKPVLHDGRLYCDLGGKLGLTCMEPGTGKEVWHNEKVTGEVVAIRNKRLVVWNGTTAATLDPAKGVIVESVKLDNIAMIKADALVDGNLYAATSNGIVSKLSPK